MFIKALSITYFIRVTGLLNYLTSIDNQTSRSGSGEVRGQREA